MEPWDRDSRYDDGSDHTTRLLIHFYSSTKCVDVNASRIITKTWGEGRRFKIKGRYFRKLSIIYRAASLISIAAICCSCKMDRNQNFRPENIKNSTGEQNQHYLNKHPTFTLHSHETFWVPGFDRL
jgi:hypothetical protein